MYSRRTQKEYMNKYQLERINENRTVEFKNLSSKEIASVDLLKKLRYFLGFIK